MTTKQTTNDRTHTSQTTNTTTTSLLVLACTVALTALILGAGGAIAETEAPSVVELRFGQAYALEPMEINATITVGNQTTTEVFRVSEGQEVQTGDHFQNLSEENWTRQHLELTTGDDLLLAMETRVEEDHIVLTNGTYDPTRLEIPRDDTSLVVATGDVTGTFHVQTQLLSPEKAEHMAARLAVDANGDGTLDEEANFPAQGDRIEASLPLEAAPATSAWRYQLEHNGTVIASWEGSWGWLRGAPVDVQQRLPDRDATFDRVDDVSFSPARDSIKGLFGVPNLALVQSAPEATEDENLTSQAWVAEFPGSAEPSEEPPDEEMSIFSAGWMAENSELLLAASAALALKGLLIAVGFAWYVSRPDRNKDGSSEPLAEQIG